MSIVSDYKQELDRCLQSITDESIRACADLMYEAWEHSRTVYVCGNGGSASTASHVTCDLNKGASVEGVRPLRVIGLTDNVAHFTALGNDLDYSEIFVGQLRNWLVPGDVVIGISASGNSPNCVKAFEYAKTNGAKTMGWLGFSGGKMKALSDVCLHVESNEYGPVEDAHLIINHMLTVMMRDRLGGARLE